MRAGDVNEGKRRTCSSSIRARRNGCSRCISNSFISNAIVLVHEVAGLSSHSLAQPSLPMTDARHWLVVRRRLATQAHLQQPGDARRVWHVPLASRRISCCRAAPVRWHREFYPHRPALDCSSECGRTSCDSFRMKARSESRCRAPGVPHRTPPPHNATPRGTRARQCRTRTYGPIRSDADWPPRDVSACRKCGVSVAPMIALSTSTPCDGHSCQGDPPTLIA